MFNDILQVSMIQKPAMTLVCLEVAETSLEHKIDVGLYVANLLTNDCLFTNKEEKQFFHSELCLCPTVTFFFF